MIPISTLFEHDKNNDASFIKTEWKTVTNITKSSKNYERLEIKIAPYFSAIYSENIIGKVLGLSIRQRCTGSLSLR